MPIDVVMPQMGESIAEGTVVRWLKKVGDSIERDEPLLEISTDKVDAEIPSPSSGTLTEIIAQEGQTVGVNTVVARIGADGEAAGASAPAPPPPQPAAAAAKPEPAPAPTPEPPAQIDTQRPEARVDAPPIQATAATEHNEEENITSLDERRRTKSSPLVRKIAQENNVDISRLQGSGVSGRVTKNDILDFLQQPKPAAAPQQPAASPQPAPAPRPPAMTFASGENNRIEPLSVMRKKIAQHMVLSKQTSAHVTTVFEVDFTAIDKLRRQYKDAYIERGTKLTFLPFIIQAVVAGLREFPIINASMDEASVIYHRDLNIGIAVALDWGLIVPIVKNADEKNILGLSKTINDLGERARTKKLSPDDVQGGTFTITNPGIYGGLFGTPIINQPQVAILDLEAVVKRPVVVGGDSIAIRPMTYLCMSWDHRALDGALAAQFLSSVRGHIEGWNG
ncbi:MAG TPA: 2-oxoglutarate dehydrogenase, E2 component, dihydrolipoamide succinyltransferase [Thermoanaerobaculia bacterium]